MSNNNDQRGGRGPGRVFHPLSEAGFEHYRHILSDVARRYAAALEEARLFGLTDERALQAAAATIYLETRDLLGHFPPAAQDYKVAADPQENLARLAEYARAAGVLPAHAFAVLVSQISGAPAGQVLEALRAEGIVTHRALLAAGPLAVAGRIQASLTAAGVVEE